MYLRYCTSSTPCGRTMWLIETLRFPMETARVGGWEGERATLGVSG